MEFTMTVGGHVFRAVVVVEVAAVVKVVVGFAVPVLEKFKETARRGTKLIRIFKRRKDI